MTQQLQSGGFAWPAPRLAAMLCAALVFATVPFGPAWTAAAAASIDGVEMPPVKQAAGLPLKLNGVGMRTYSMFRIHIYVAGLYLEQPTSDADAILKSDGAKLLDIHFVHDVNAEQARDAWVQGFEENCRAPCHLNGQDLLHFLAQVPAFRRGDESTLLFVGRTVQISLNGRTMGTISDADFTRAILATFIGPHPPSEPFKNGLLGMPN
jgi:hypothetical protein